LVRKGKVVKISYVKGKIGRKHVTQKRSIFLCK